MTFKGWNCDSEKDGPKSDRKITPGSAKPAREYHSVCIILPPLIRLIKNKTKGMEK